MTYYIAQTDENGVLCVESLDGDPYETDVSGLADHYRDAIYFEVTPPPPLYSYKEAVTRIRQEMAPLHFEDTDLLNQIDAILERTVKS